MFKCDESCPQFREREENAACTLQDAIVHRGDECILLVKFMDNRRVK